MNEIERQHQIRELMDEFGLEEEDAAFGVRLAAGETKGDLQVITLPLPEDEARRYADLLIEQHGFTFDEATRYVAGDRNVIDAVAARRRAAEEHDQSNARASRAPLLSAD
jgi:hypothetical protein